MSTEGSYHVESFATNTEAEIRRLNAQVDLFWPVEREVYVRSGMRDGMTLLDCGCGPGHLIGLLKEQMASLRCVGAEIDPILVEVAAQRFRESGLRDCRVVQGSAESVELPGGSFDFIILRLVLEHVPDPVLALRHLASLLKPSGKLLVIDNDFEFHLRTDPPVPELGRLYEAYCASRRKDGGDPCIGRRLPFLFVEAGLALDAFEIEVVHNALVGDGAFLKAEGAGIPAQLVQSGFLDQGTFESMARSWRAMLSAPVHSIMRPLFVAVGHAGAAKPCVVAESEPKTWALDLGRLSAPVAPAGEAAEGSLGLVLSLLAKVLERSRVGPDDSLAALGLDSLAAMALQEQIKARTGVELPIVKFLEDRPARELAVLLGGRGSPEGARAPSKPVSSAGAGQVEEGEI